MGPGNAPPNAIPVKLMITAVAASRRGANSALSATIFGNMPPIPIPARKRRMASCATEPDQPANNGICTLLAAWSGSVAQLAILRFLAGIGIGGILPNIVALNAEFAPRRLAATAVIMSFTGIAFGGALPGPIAAFLVPHYGWPILFII